MIHFSHIFNNKLTWVDSHQLSTSQESPRKNWHRAVRISAAENGSRPMDQV